MNKYKNKKTVVNNITFDSKAEARRYIELKQQEKAGVIKDLELQPRFLLQSKYVNANGKKIQAIYYVADFSYIYGMFYIIEDVKGVETAVFKLKRKLFEAKYPYIITTVK
jgi:hypothetical protein